MESEADLSDLLLISHQSTEDLHPKQTSPGGPVVFFPSFTPLVCEKKTWASNYQETFLAALPVTPTSAHTKMAVHRSSNQPPSITQLQGHPDGRCCCQPKRPHTRSALGPWLFGTPQKEEEEMTQKRRPERYMFMHGTPEDHWVFASEMHSSSLNL